ncbi:MAG: DUF5060 domain-containing protein [Candidatus Sumerlaeia bacterium]
MVMKRYAAVLLIFCLSSLACPLFGQDGVWTVDGKAGDKGGWQRDNLLPLPPGMEESDSAHLEVRTEMQGDQRILNIPARFPSPCGLMRLVGDDRKAWGKGQTVRVDIFAPAELGNVSAQLITHHKIWGWFVTKPTRQFKSGEWVRLYWPLDADHGDWVSVDGEMAWNDTMRYKLHRIGIRFFSSETMSTEIKIGEVAIEGVNTPPPALEIRNMIVKPAELKKGRRVEFSFDLSRAYDNPYDPEEIRIDGIFQDATGQTYEIPAFYYQDFVRSQLKDGTEQCRPVGKACWKLRYLPMEAGEHSFFIRMSDLYGDRYETSPQTFTVADAPFKGLIRVDPDDPSYLSFTNGDFYFPLGLIVRSPDDNRQQYDYEFEMKEGMGTFAYDYYFQGMADAGINFSRVWMSAWWTAIEWTHGYRSDYADIGRYNQLNAWRLDYVMDLGEKLGIYIDLTLHNHGQFRAQNFDTEWYDNPYYSGQGGPVERPEEFWTDEESRHYLKKRLRYILARWSASPSLAFWELCNEVDLVGNYNSRNIRSWHQAMGSWMKEADPYNHIVTTHYTSNRFDPNVMGLPEMEVAQSTAYRTDMIHRCVEMYQDHAIFGKPVYVNEFGVGRSHLELQHNLHSGLWASSVMPFCGPALFWWWPYVHEKGEYYQYKGIVRFHEGEDYRGRDFQLTYVRIPRQEDSDPGMEPLGALGMQNDHEARLWFYDTRMYRTGNRREPMVPVARPIPAGTASLDGLKPGKYRVQFWDTWKGRPMEAHTFTIQHKGGPFEIQVPGFEKDIACKIDFLE